MLAATEGSIRSLSEDDGELVVDSLTSAKLALEQLYESGAGQLPKEEILVDLIKVVEISERIKSIGNSGERIKIFFSEYQTLSNQFLAKYSDFLPDRVIRKLKYGEKYVEGLKKLLVAQWYMLQAFDDESLDNQAGKLYTGMVNLSKVLEQYIPYFSKNQIEVAKNIALVILADPALQLEQTNISQVAVNYLIALKNTARGVLWQIDNRKEKKHTVGELLDWLETAPSWTGDDFEECLEYVNRVRK